MKRLPLLFQWRRVLGGLASLLFGLAVVAVLDGIQHMARHDPFHLVLVAGESHTVSGWIPANASGDPRIETDPPLEFLLQGNQTGYYLGGAQWLGRVTVPVHTSPGQFNATVAFPGLPLQTIHIQVVASKAAQQALAPSFLLRTLGVPPYAAAALLAVFGLAATAIIFRISSQIEAILEPFGLMETNINRHGQLFLPWGSRHGLIPEKTILLEDLSGRSLGKAHVQQVWEDHAQAWAPRHLRGPVLVKRPVDLK